ncbi:hypothetical protein BDK51DRAFT_52592 [Blyttiomyces helicus]|uniref:Uncharacterized protein n=1 Tax=Blyttiomyces helicus TaxID=388810 RepID=A0A4V1IQ43_9FUNG|nr:hypothetical protein BDK51DRAFT_52592 [Blyttiomyces helicus]|eukprot:RKO85257.1 hypothetical protein BDK51DRAFT_52592 [Blyttiomyces helicus]
MPFFSDSHIISGRAEGAKKEIKRAAWMVAMVMNGWLSEAMGLDENAFVPTRPTQLDLFKRARFPTLPREALSRIPLQNRFHSHSAKDLPNKNVPALPRRVRKPRRSVAPPPLVVTRSPKKLPKKHPRTAKSHKHHVSPRRTWSAVNQIPVAPRPAKPPPALDSTLDVSNPDSFQALIDALGIDPYATFLPQAGPPSPPYSPADPFGLCEQDEELDRELDAAFEGIDLDDEEDPEAESW